ncbi:cellulose binding domain-containing protein [Streptomyces flavovirens]|uniref:glucuronyl esterase domain-containing protein n=1 Tax=Streptomyces flavovirens TaxID=52258 RepID=UPI003D13B13F
MRPRICGPCRTVGVLSRIIDVIEQSGGSLLTADATGASGCSRFGKGAFVAGAFDQRIALTMPIESGSGGAPAFRALASESGAQPLSSAYSEQPWLGDAFGSYTGNPASLPVDTHEIVAMVAPRGLLLMENSHVDWLGARSGSVAALSGAEVYKALGVPGNISYWSDVQDGTHCAAWSEWRTPLQQNIQKYLLHSGSASGVFRVSSLKSGSLSGWRDWQTPTLTEGGGTPGDGGGPGHGGDPGDGGGVPGDGGSDGTCATHYETLNAWSGGFQGEATVHNDGSTALIGRDRRPEPGARPVDQQPVDGEHSGTRGLVTVRNTSWNGPTAPGATVVFGFTAAGSSTPAPSGLTRTGS